MSPSPKCSILNTIFQRFIIPLMRSNGWTVEEKIRSSASLHRQIDRYFFPPGICRGHGYKQRVDFWDSTSLLMTNLKIRTDVISQFIYKFYDRVKDLARREGKDLAKDTRTDYDQILKILVSKVNMPLPEGIQKTAEILYLWDSNSCVKAVVHKLSNPKLSTSSAAGIKRKRIETTAKRVQIAVKKSVLELADDLSPITSAAKCGTTNAIRTATHDLSNLNEEIRHFENLCHYIQCANPIENVLLPENVINATNRNNKTNMAPDLSKTKEETHLLEKHLHSILCAKPIKMCSLQSLDNNTANELSASRNDLRAQRKQLSRSMASEPSGHTSDGNDCSEEVATDTTQDKNNCGVQLFPMQTGKIQENSSSPRKQLRHAGKNSTLEA